MLCIRQWFDCVVHGTHNISEHCAVLVRGHMLGLSQHRVSLYLHEYASWIHCEAGILYIELRAPISLSHIPIRRDPGLLKGISAFRIDLCCSNEIRGLS